MVKDLHDDYFLWKSFKEGDDESFSVLYDRYADDLYRYGMHFTRDKEFIKDCIHDLFLELYKYREKLSMTDSIRFYLLRSLRRKIASKQTKPAVFFSGNILQTMNGDQESSPEESIVASETEENKNNLLMKAMKNLTDQQREVLSLKFEQTLSYSEISEILGVSIESARTAVYRSIKLLRESIQ